MRALVLFFVISQIPEARSQQVRPELRAGLGDQLKYYQAGLGVLCGGFQRGQEGEIKSMVESATGQQVVSVSMNMNATTPGGTIAVKLDSRSPAQLLMEIYPAPDDRGVRYALKVVNAVAPSALGGRVEKVLYAGSGYTISEQTALASFLGEDCQHQYSHLYQYNADGWQQQQILDSEGHITEGRVECPPPDPHPELQSLARGLGAILGVMEDQASGTTQQREARTFEREITFLEQRLRVLQQRYQGLDPSRRPFFEAEYRSYRARYLGQLEEFRRCRQRDERFCGRSRTGVARMLGLHLPGRNPAGYFAEGIQAGGGENITLAPIQTLSPLAGGRDYFYDAVQLSRQQGTRAVTVVADELDQESQRALNRAIQDHPNMVFVVPVGVAIDSPNVIHAYSEDSEAALRMGDLIRKMREINSEMSAERTIAIIKESMAGGDGALDEVRALVLTRDSQ